jgi:hypothetical protein
MLRSKKARPTAILIALAALLVVAGTVAVTAADTKGPSSSATPYLVSVDPAAKTTSLLTVGDSVNNKPDGTPYRMVGIPDGLGTFDNGDGTFTLVMNHELVNTIGVERAHGAKGAFVSKWIIRKSDLTVVSGADLIQQVATWNTATSSYNAPAKGVAFSRFCSADLAPLSAFYNAATTLGYNGRIFMNGEESGNEGRAIGHLMDGTSYELPRLGKFSWENSVANKASGDKTVVVGTDDGTGGQVYIYVGTKTSTGTPVEKAGLTNGTLFGIKVAGLTTETVSSTLAPATAFTLVDLGNVENTTGAALETASTANGVTNFLRPEDGSWDPTNPKVFYFATTASISTPSRLWRLTFNDPANPAAGGTIDMVLDGTEGQRMLDNLTVNSFGQVLIQEDPGNNDRIAKLWRYNTATDKLVLLAQHDPERFTPGAAGFITQDEESSGIIDVSDILGAGWYLLGVQVHKASADAELAEGGQLVALYFPNTSNNQLYLPLVTM